GPHGQPGERAADRGRGRGGRLDVTRPAPPARAGGAPPADGPGAELGPAPAPRPQAGLGEGGTAAARHGPGRRGGGPDRPDDESGPHPADAPGHPRPGRPRRDGRRGGPARHGPRMRRSRRRSTARPGRWGRSGTSWASPPSVVGAFGRNPPEQQAEGLVAGPLLG